nr:hypothetical protein [Tanacetum cinerariifolium]
ILTLLPLVDMCACLVPYCEILGDMIAWKGFTDKNLCRTLRDYSQPSHEDYRNTIEVPSENDLAPLRSDTIRLVQNGCSFYELPSEDPNQHLKDFLKIMDYIDLNVETKERTHLRQTINQAAGGKLRDKNDEESWALFEDLALYDNESRNDLRDFAQPVKAISMPHDVQRASDHPKRAFIEYSSMRTDEARNKWYTLTHRKTTLVTLIIYHGKVTRTLGGGNPKILKIIFQTHLIDSNQMVYTQTDPSTTLLKALINQFSKENWLTLWHLKTLRSRFEADFKQYQSEVTKKLDTFLKASSDQITRLLPSDTVKNLKLNTNPTSSACSHPAGDPQSSSSSFKSVNAIQTCFKSDTCDKKDQLQVNTLTVSENETPTLKEPKKTLEDEFAELNLNRLVLEVLAHVPMYDALHDKYRVSLKLGENGSEYIQSIAPEKIKDPSLFILSCILGDSKPFDTLADLGSCVNLLPLKLFKGLKVGLLEETDDFLGLADGTKSYPVGIVRNVEVHVGKLKLFKDFYVVDMEREPTCPLLVERGFLATANAVIYCKKAKIVVGEGLTRSIFMVKELDFGDDNEPYWSIIGKHFWNNYLPDEWEIARDVEVNPFKDVLVFRKMVEFLGAMPINMKGNMWESEDLIENPIN